MFCENGGFFWTKYRHESYVFFTEWTVFWQNMGMRALIFSWKSKKKGHPIDSLGPLWSVVLTELTFFWPIMCMMAGVFHEKFLKMTLEHRVLERRDVFWQNMGIRFTCFLEIGFFWTKFRRKSSHFFVKSRKKLHPIDFFGPQFPYIAVLTELAFFWFMGENGEKLVRHPYIGR